MLGILGLRVSRFGLARFSENLLNPEWELSLLRSLRLHVEGFKVHVESRQLPPFAGLSSDSSSVLGMEPS